MLIYCIISYLSDISFFFFFKYIPAHLRPSIDLYVFCHKIPPFCPDTAKSTTFFAKYLALQALQHQNSTRHPQTAPPPNGTAGRCLSAVVRLADTTAFSCFKIFRLILAVFCHLILLLIHATPISMVSLHFYLHLPNPLKKRSSLLQTMYGGMFTLLCVYFLSNRLILPYFYFTLKSYFSLRAFILNCFSSS